MRDEIVCIIIFLLLIGLFTLNSHIVETHTQNVMQEIEKVKTVDDFKDVLDIWNKEKKPLFYMCSHSLLMQVDENLVLAYDHIREDDEKRARHSLKKAKILLEDLSEREKIKLDNIF